MQHGASPASMLISMLSGMLSGISCVLTAKPERPSLIKAQGSCTAIESRRPYLRVQLRHHVLQPRSYSRAFCHSCTPRRDERVELRYQIPSGFLQGNCERGAELHLTLKHLEVILSGRRDTRELPRGCGRLERVGRASRKPFPQSLRIRDGLRKLRVPKRVSQHHDELCGRCHRRWRRGKSIGLDARRRQQCRRGSAARTVVDSLRRSGDGKRSTT
mmetsp:Transcript_27744/g.55831  ORF Transcript_27744/g.55831 Transcript_27744/m.55831 type:complete len:216 (+) Transcript_27744:297-944(+)